MSLTNRLKMRKVHYDTKGIRRILGKKGKNIGKIEKSLSCKMHLDKNKEITIQSSKGRADQEYFVEEVLDALSLGFDIETALLLQDVDYSLKVIDLKNYARGSRLKVISGRIIGKEGKAKRVIQELSNCKIVISDHKIGIIGKTEDIEIASKAIEKIIRGAPHRNVFKFLEKSQDYLKEQRRLAEELKEE